MAQKFSRRHLGQLLLLGLGGIGAAHVLRKTAPIGRDIGRNETAQAVLHDNISPSLEVEQASLTLVLFTDYRCPACKLANDAMEKAIRQDKHVRVSYRDWPIFGPLSERAARIAIASDRQSIYPLVHSTLMQERRALDEGVMRQAIESSGGNWTQIEADVRLHADDIERQLNRNRSDAFQLNISGTPTYLAGSILLTGAQDDDTFTRLFAAGREAREV